MRLREESGVRVKPVSALRSESAISAPQIRATSQLSETRPGGLYWSSTQPPEFASPYITRANGVSQGQHFPFTFPTGPGPFPNFQFGSLMPLYVPGYYNHNQTQTAEHYNLTIQRQLDKATVLTVGYVGTQGHHIQRGIPLMWGNAALCQSLSGCGPGGEGGVYMQGGQTYYGTFTGLINDQAI